MTMTAAEKWHAEQQRMKESAARWPNRDDDRYSWPVLVEETIQHVIWVEAETHEAALDRARYDTWEKLSNETRNCSWMNLEMPKDAYDWDRVYEESFDGYQGVECNAHVETRRWWLAELDLAHKQATAENEDRDGVDAEQRVTCPLCRTWREDGHETKFPHLFEVRSAERRAQEAVAL